MSEQTVLDAIAALQADVDAVKAKTDALGAFAVTVTNPVAASGTITLEQGDSYPDERGREIVILVADEAHALALDDISASVLLRTAEFAWEATSVTSTTAGYTVTFEPTVAQTAAVRSPKQHYKLIVYYETGV